MKAKTYRRLMWAVKKRTTHKSIDGARACLHGVPRHLFETRREAREWIAENFGYIRKRDDLQRAPHGWTVPQAVRVFVTIEERE